MNNYDTLAPMAVTTPTTLEEYQAKWGRYAVPQKPGHYHKSFDESASFIEEYVREYHMTKNRYDVPTVHDTFDAWVRPEHSPIRLIWRKWHRINLWVQIPILTLFIAIGLNMAASWTSIVTVFILWAASATVISWWLTKYKALSAAHTAYLGVFGRTR